MFRIKTMNKISPTGLAVLDAARFSVSEAVENEDGVLVRSADMLEYQFPPALRAIARAGRAPTTSPSTAAPRAASWCSTPPAPTPTR